jgi:hypothetical protein
VNKFFNPSSVVIVAILVSALITAFYDGKINWDKVAANAITYYFVYMRGQQDGER